jgi:hypothetical protein
VVPLAQPYRALIKEILEKQKYPVRHYTPGGEMMKPYDITSWSLPLHRQVNSYEIETRDKGLEGAIQKLEQDVNLAGSYPDTFKAAIFNVNDNAGFRAAFIALEQGIPVSRLTEDITLDGKVLPKGSFVIQHAKKSTDGWKMIQDEIKIIAKDNQVSFNLKVVVNECIGISTAAEICNLQAGGTGKMGNSPASGNNHISCGIIGSLVIIYNYFVRNDLVTDPVKHHKRYRMFFDLFQMVVIPGLFGDRN